MEIVKTLVLVWIIKPCDVLDKEQYGMEPDLSLSNLIDYLHALTDGPCTVTTQICTGFDFT
ncbi:hypothetical protein NC651_038982 [Populus alba x Populus x berolinensis]|nr:hypothetical protein NC651_038982 [Populus alba x Populus x berolinensis]